MNPNQERKSAENPSQSHAPLAKPPVTVSNSSSSLMDKAIEELARQLGRFLAQRIASDLKSRSGSLDRANLNED